MNFLRYTTRMLQSTSPVGLLVGGTVLYLGLPILRKGLRCVAVLTGRALYSVTEEARNLKNQALQPEEVHS